MSAYTSITVERTDGQPIEVEPVFRVIQDQLNTGWGDIDLWDTGFDYDGEPPDFDYFGIGTTASCSIRTKYTLDNYAERVEPHDAHHVWKRASGRLGGVHTITVRETYDGDGDEQTGTFIYRRGEWFREESSEGMEVNLALADAIPVGVQPMILTLFQLQQMIANHNIHEDIRFIVIPPKERP